MQGAQPVEYSRIKTFIMVSFCKFEDHLMLKANNVLRCRTESEALFVRCE